MKTAPLPEIINPSRLALSGVEITGEIKVAELNRLQQLLCSDAGVLKCRVGANKDQQNRVKIFGSIDATLEMDCQLCLKPMEIQLQQQFELMVVENDQQAAEVLENYEPILVHNDKVILEQLIEDEALLALPLAPSHDLKQACQKHENFSEEVAQKTQGETKQPFANLKSLMEQSTDKKD